MDHPAQPRRGDRRLKGARAGRLSYTAADIVRTRTTARQMIEQVQTFAGPLKVPGVLPKLSRTPGRIGEGGPQLGEHTDEMCWPASASPMNNAGPARTRDHLNAQGGQGEACPPASKPQRWMGRASSTLRNPRTPHEQTPVYPGSRHPRRLPDRSGLRANRSQDRPDRPSRKPGWRR